MSLPFSQIGYHVLHLNVPGASVGISVPAPLTILYHPGSSRSSLIAISEFVRSRLYPADLLTSSNRLWLLLLHGSKNVYAILQYHWNIIRTTSTIYDNYIEMREGMAQRLLIATGEIKSCIGSPNFSKSTNIMYSNRWF